MGWSHSGHRWLHGSPVPRTRFPSGSRVMARTGPTNAVECYVAFPPPATHTRRVLLTAAVAPAAWPQRPSDGNPLHAPSKVFCRTQVCRCWCQGFRTHDARTVPLELPTWDLLSSGGGRGSLGGMCPAGPAAPGAEPVLHYPVPQFPPKHAAAIPASPSLPACQGRGHRRRVSRCQQPWGDVKTSHPMTQARPALRKPCGSPQLLTRVQMTASRGHRLRAT